MPTTPEKPHWCFSCNRAVGPDEWYRTRKACKKCENAKGNKRRKSKARGERLRKIDQHIRKFDVEDPTNVQQMHLASKTLLEAFGGARKVKDVLMEWLGREPGVSVKIRIIQAIINLDLAIQTAKAAQRGEVDLEVPDSVQDMVATLASPLRDLKHQGVLRDVLQYLWDREEIGPEDVPAVGASE